MCDIQLLCQEASHIDRIYYKGRFTTSRRVVWENCRNIVACCPGYIHFTFQLLAVINVASSSSSSVAAAVASSAALSLEFECFELARFPPWWRESYPIITRFRYDSVLLHLHPALPRGDPINFVITPVREIILIRTPVQDIVERPRAESATKGKCVELPRFSLHDVFFPKNQTHIAPTLPGNYVNREIVNCWSSEKVVCNYLRKLLIYFS